MGARVVRVTFRFLLQGFDAAVDFARGMLGLAATGTRAGKIGVDLGVLSIASRVVVLLVVDGFLGAAQLIMRTLQVGWRVTLRIRLIRLLYERPGHRQLLSGYRALGGAASPKGGGDECQG